MNRYTTLLLLALSLLTAEQVSFAQQPQVELRPSIALPETDDGLAGVGPIRRYKWFKKLWVRKRSTWLTQREQDQEAVVFLGDSITQGWGDQMGGNFGEMKVANRGISGDTTRGMLLRLEEDVLILKPKAVVLLMGTNDLEELAMPEQIGSNFELIVQSLKKHNAEMPIVVSLVFPSSSEKKRPADKIKKVNELYREAVKGDPQITVIDTWTLFADKDGDAKKAEFPDLLHPNKKGYAKWASALRPVFATLGFLETEQTNFEFESDANVLFNGRDLNGWCFLPTTEQMMKSRNNWKSRPAWPVVKERIDFDDEMRTEDRRYAAINGRLVVTTPPEGRKIQQLWTSKEFNDDFTLKLEFRATPNADSGIFLRGKQLQCRDFLLAGPYKKLKNYRAGDWNEMEIKVTGTSAHCSCNGEVLEADFKIPKTGPLGLEGDRGQIEYRRIRVLPN